jgi:hypothetical protein
MPSNDQAARVYHELAKHYEGRGEAQMRDRFLVLAADALQSAGQRAEAERLRAHLLQVNPHHLLKPFASLEEALKAADVQNYVEGLRRTYPKEKATHLLESVRKGTGDHAAGSAKPNAVAERPAKGAAPSESGPVYRIQDDARKSAPLAQPVQGTRSAKEGKAVGPAVPLRTPAKSPAARPPVAGSSWREPAVGPWRNGPVEADADAPAGAWLTVVLFWLLMLGGLAFSAFIFGQPFLPL